jgi:uncharacterized protein (TIGR03118 family)
MRAVDRHAAFAVPYSRSWSWSWPAELPRTEKIHRTINLLRRGGNEPGQGNALGIREGDSMNTWRNVKVWFAGGLAVAGLLAACGGGDDGSNVAPQPIVGTDQSRVYAVTNLVSDDPAVPASHTDPNLQNGWGVAFNPKGFAWVAANHTSKSTLYDGNGVPQSLVVSVPATNDADPTGIVFNATQDFKVTQGAASAPAAFIFVGEAGTVSGWAPSVNQNASVTMFDGSAANKVYKGLAIASFNGTNYLYATDFHNGKVDVFNGSFALTALPGGFANPALPAGYAPFGIQAIGDRIYVAYAKRAATGDDEQAGDGLGVVAVFDTGGTLIKQLAVGGALNAPWGIALAPANFGLFSGALLVGNFGDGKINAFDPASGNMMGTLSKADGTPIAVDGLWGIAFGNDVQNQPSNTLFFAAGPADEAHGLYGRIDLKQ